MKKQFKEFRNVQMELYKHYVREENYPTLNRELNVKTYFVRFTQQTLNGMYLKIKSKLLNKLNFNPMISM